MKELLSDVLLFHIDSYVERRLQETSTSGIPVFIMQSIKTIDRLDRKALVRSLTLNDPR